MLYLILFKTSRNFLAIWDHTSMPGTICRVLERVACITAMVLFVEHILQEMHLSNCLPYKLAYASCVPAPLPAQKSSKQFLLQPFESQLAGMPA